MQTLAQKDSKELWSHKGGHAYLEQGLEETLNMVGNACKMVGPAFGDAALYVHIQIINILIDFGHTLHQSSLA
ncbi:hypothetical protein VNO77_41896 [Canavalia gladiata]|uniref:Uncharacterized protein n=1 Tax=Canavalia gladiata TaxID=3824 RepID=A0AAN9K1D6_CANGL